MRAFEYASPVTLKEALGLLGASWSDANILAGGTDQISLMKEEIHTPRRVVDIKRIKELSGIAKAGGGLRIGATTTVEELLSNASVRTEYPVLFEAAHGVRSPQVRNMGTVGGDVCQRPRCWYFRNGFGLLAIKDGKSLVAEGQNEFHAIFDHGPARFVSASSFGPALVALGATFTIASPGGARKVEASRFFVAPESDTQREADLKPNEILTEIVIPAARGAKSATYEVRQREALDWPLVAASVVLRMKGSQVESARVVLGHVAAVPHVAKAAEQALAGQTLTADLAARAGEAAAEGARPLSGNAYKVQLAKVAVKRAVLAAGGIKA